MAYPNPFSRKGWKATAFTTAFIIFSLCLTLLPSSTQGGDIADDDERFPVFEACQMKYGYFPAELYDNINPAQSPSGTTAKRERHNKGLEECQQMYYRQKFCRNQYREMKGESYQRICKNFNKNYLKFFAMVFGAIGCGAFLRTLMKLLKLNIPYTVLLMLIGMGLGALANINSFCPDWTAYTKVARTNPHIILNVFLPVLIFESSFNMKSHLFFRSFISILVLALPGMVLTTFTTAFLCKTFFFSYKWTIWEAVLFGSIISATDPVAVVSILKEVGTSETLGVLVDGESLLNDGVAILFYEIFSEIVNAADNPLPDPDSQGPSHIIWLFARITLGGPLFGWIVAKMTIFYLSFIFNDAVIEVSVTLCAAYLTYFVGETFLKVSGVMALVFLGITLSSERTCISPEVQGLVMHFWEMLSYLANTVLFVLVGIVITETAANSFKPDDGYYLIFLYFALNIIRLAMIGIMSPLLSRIGYGLSWQNMIVMTWGGLRGAVGICLALQVFQDKKICHKDTVGPKILLHTAGIVILTLLVNGTTTKTLLDMLKLTELSMGKIQDMANAVRQIRSAQHRSLRILRHDRFLSDANWTIVEESTNIVNPYVEMHVRAKEQEDDIPGQTPSLLEDLKRGSEDKKIQCPKCETQVENEPSEDEIRELTEEARLRLLKALKVSCWRQYEQGILTEEAVQILTDLLEKTEDRKYQMIHASDFDKYWDVKGICFWLRRKLLPYTSGTFETETYPLPKEPWRHVFNKIASSCFFSLFIYIIIIANMVPACWEAYYITVEHRFTKDEYIYFYIINVGFTSLYLLEFAIKVLGMGFGEYMNSRWNIADAIILIVCIVEVILSGTYLKEELEQSDEGTVVRSKNAQEADFLKFVRFIRLARMTRIFRFFKPLIPFIMKYLNNRVNQKIFLSYDLGKGFIAAVDDVQKFLPQMIDNARILLKFRTSLELQRVEIIKQMGLLQKEHPGIAIAVKTRHASRAVLNQMKDSLCELKEDGLVDEKEFDSLMEEIEQMMKHLWDSPAYMKPTSAELTLANVTWMAASQGGGKELFEYIYKQATLLTFHSGDVICNYGDPANGIYIIVNGLVKIHYSPTFEIITEREAYGIIPNVEVFQDLTYENEMDDYFTTGTVIGELGVLTDNQRGAKVTCETAVTLFHIPQSAMKKAIEAFHDPYDSLEARIWRTYGMKVAATLLPMEPAFASWNMDKVKTYLELSAVPIGERYKELLVPDFVADVVVIYGQVCNYNDMEEIYTAPCVVPKTCGHIRAKPGTIVPSRVLIIASQDVEHWAESDEEESDDDASRRGLDDYGSRNSQISLQRFIIAGTKGASITEAEALSIQLQRQSRAVNFGVVAANKSKSKISIRRVLSTVTGRKKSHGHL